MRCSQCHRVLKQSPPKHTISNLITIGTLPKSMSATLTEVTGPLLSQKKLLQMLCLTVEVHIKKYLDHLRFQPECGTECWCS